MPGIIGVLQATEVLKLLLRKGKPLAGRFLVYNSLESVFQSFSIEKNPSCPLCGQPQTIKALATTGDERRVAGGQVESSPGVRKTNQRE